ncbi:putative membrane protein [Arthrobacter sp. SO5]|uniref:LapA family protein n=1 Tax=Arthrobacter sp. SO5 TaxID=1897055 RepID=UPI001E4F10A4|nr:lipopolysaccharide assembly protein LapA domain-containing protein [Arthrobacter sp. SO5]MCB5272843.1 putative membrane protein [Arthrobacter sp. SO5]
MTQTPQGFEPTGPADSQPPAEDTGHPEYAGTARVPAGSAEVLPAAEPASTERPRAASPEPVPAPGPEPRRVTRAGMVWAAVASALVVLILLIAFILQNQDYVQVKFFGLQGSVALGVALFIAAVGGGVLVAIAGAARIIQLRLAAHRQRSRANGGR